MTRAAATAVGRTARIALLLATALGLALMHTLGHTDVRTGPHSAMTGMSTTAVGAAEMLSAVVATAQPCPDGHCDGHGSGAWSACLAILTGLAVVVMLLWLLTLVQGRRLLAVPAVPRVLSPRAPPDRPTGLTLASAAVLRL